MRREYLNISTSVALIAIGTYVKHCLKRRIILQSWTRWKVRNVFKIFLITVMTRKIPDSFNMATKTLIAFKFKPLSSISWTTSTTRSILRHSLYGYLPPFPNMALHTIAWCRGSVQQSTRPTHRRIFPPNRGKMFASLSGSFSIFYNLQVNNEREIVPFSWYGACVKGFFHGFNACFNFLWQVVSYTIIKHAVFRYNSMFLTSKWFGCLF